MHTLFVYGSLKRGGAAAHFLENSEYLGEACTARAGYSMRAALAGDDPSHFDHPIVEEGEARIAGELYLIDAETLRAIDEFEENGVDYIRALTLMDNGVDAGMYIFIHHDGYPLPLGASDHVRYDDALNCFRWVL